MRKYALLCVMLFTCLFLAACEGRKLGDKKEVSALSAASETPGQNPAVAETPTGSAETSEGSTEALQGGTEERTDTAGKVSGDSLRLLETQPMRCLSDTGYYYIPEDSQELKKDFWGRRIMYMDFATKQEVYLCNEPGCRHNDKNCTAVLTEDVLNGIGSALLFIWKDKLYMVSRDNDDENSVSQYIDGDGNAVEAEKQPTVIYSMGMDGTKRKKEYTFAKNIMVGDTVLCDGEGIYFMAKQMDTSAKKGTAYVTASKREIVRYQPEKAAVESVCSLEFDDQIQWQMMGCCDGKVIVTGTEYNQKLSFEEEMKLGQEEYWEYARDSQDIYAALDLQDASLHKIYSVKNDSDYLSSAILSGDFLYVSKEKGQTIDKVDLKTGKAKTLVKLEQGFLAGALSDKLCCQAWDQTKDHGYYFVDCNTGKVEYSSLCNKRNGWELEIIGEYQDQVLVIYDCEGEELKEEEAWDISRYQYGLIAKKDLCQGRDRFEKIAMKGPGK